MTHSNQSKTHSNQSKTYLCQRSDRGSQSLKNKNSELQKALILGRHPPVIAVCSTIVPVGSGTIGQELQHQHKQLLGMEPIRKRPKLANEQQSSLIFDQPDSFIKYVVSFWDFQSLLAFRQTNHRFKRIAEEDMKRRSLEALPVD
jgi:hypothetical protein